MSDARKRAEKALLYNRTHANSPRVRAALVEALEALLASEPAKAPFVSRNEEWGLRPDFTTAGVTAPPDGAEVREAAEAKATALLGSARHYFAQGHPMREAIDEHLAALRGGQKGEGR